MFMVCADFQGKDKKLLASACRSAMMHYRSTLMDFIYKIIFVPFFIFGGSEEKQQLHIELFSDYEEHEVCVQNNHEIVLKPACCRMRR